MQTTIENELTRQTWQHWRQIGAKPNLTWLELHKLAEQLTQKCRMANSDSQQPDFRSMVDPELDYYEYLNALNVQTSQLSENAVLAYDVGTQKLRQKLTLLRASYGHLKKRLTKQKQQNKRLRLRLKKKRRKRKGKVSH